MLNEKKLEDRLKYYKYYLRDHETYGAIFALCELCHQDYLVMNEGDLNREFVKVDAPCFAQYCQGNNHKQLKSAANISKSQG